nr:hypothetical protein [Halomicroarcula laminariae]
MTVAPAESLSLTLADVSDVNSGVSLISETDTETLWAFVAPPRWLRRSARNCWFVSCQENDIVCLSGVEQLSSKPNESRVRFLDAVLIAVGFVGDEPAGFVHHRRHERIGVIEFVGDDDLALFESIRIGYIS